MSMNSGPGTFPPGYSSPNYRSPHHYEHRVPSGSQIVQYTIQPGDTFWELARRYNTTLDAIMSANPGVNPNNLYVGQVISIPDPPPEHRMRYRNPNRVVCPRSYTVRPGDTLYNISYRFGIPPKKIVAANPYINFGLPLAIGQFICLPYW